MKRVHVLVSGRVQGVSFRAWTREEARSRGVAGWVRNLDDGRVEAVFEGADPDVDAMAAWCHRGSPGARVDRVEISDRPAEGLVGFRVR